jgi:hypothetical protein
VLEIFPSPLRAAPGVRGGLCGATFRCQTRVGAVGAPHPASGARIRQPTRGTRVGAACEHATPSWCPPLVVPGRARVGVPAGSFMPGGGWPSGWRWPVRWPGDSPSDCSRPRGSSGPRRWRWRRASWRPAPGRAAPRPPSSRCSWARSCCPEGSPAKPWPSSVGTRHPRCSGPTGASPSGRPTSTPAISGRLPRPSRTPAPRQGWWQTVRSQGPGRRCCGPGRRARRSRCWSGPWEPWGARSCSRRGRRPGRPSGTSRGPRRTSTRSWCATPGPRLRWTRTRSCAGARRRRWRSPWTSGCSGRGCSSMPGREGGPGRAGPERDQRPGP